MLCVEHNAGDNYYQKMLELKARLDALEKNVDKDHGKLEQTINGIKKHNEEQDERAQRIKDKMNELKLQTQTCLQAFNDSTSERKELNQNLSSVISDVQLIKRDMERIADTKKHTVQHIMSIVGPVVTAALILWLGLG